MRGRPETVSFLRRGDSINSPSQPIRERVMGDVINLNRFRKARARAEDAKQAEENRSRFGRSKEQKRRQEREDERKAKDLDGKKLD
jgi:hypothetical protein